jgi:hypothetical protein
MTYTCHLYQAAPVETVTTTFPAKGEVFKLKQSVLVWRYMWQPHFESAMQRTTFWGKGTPHIKFPENFHADPSLSPFLLDPTKHLNVSFRR